MKIIISESQIKDKITNLINTMGFLETSRMFGGINPFKRIIDSNPELKSLFGYYFYGIADVDLLTKERTRISYQFEIIDFGLDQEFLTLYINIKVDTLQPQIILHLNTLIYMAQYTNDPNILLYLKFFLPFFS
jgi:hypothetical protein